MGYTLEEYRGFKVNGAWKHLNPLYDKDVFVLDYVNNLGTGDFSNLGVTIHNLNTAQAVDEFDNVSSRVINYRWRTAHNGDQHGIFLYRRDNLVDELGRPLPGWTQGSLNGAPVCLINKLLIDNTFGAQAPDALRMAIGHELGHACNLAHHGYIIVNGVPTGYDGTTIYCVMCNVMNFQNLYHVYCSINPGCIGLYWLH